MNLFLPRSFHSSSFMASKSWQFIPSGAEVSHTYTFGTIMSNLQRQIRILLHQQNRQALRPVDLHDFLKKSS